MTLFGAAARFLKFSTGPSTPSSGQVALYSRSDDRFYKKDSTGAERLADNALPTLRPVRVASTANITFASPAPSAIDGVTLVANDRVLIKNQTTTSENGIYDFISTSVPLVRASDADTAEKVERGTAVVVLEGTYNRLKAFMQILNVDSIGVDPQRWGSIGFVDSSNALNYPSAASHGQLFWDESNRSLRVWNAIGTSWTNLNGPYVCTSSTRPTFPVSEMVIFETDTNLSYIRYNSAWVLIGGSSAATNKAPTRQVFATPGTFTNGWTKPAGMVYCEVMVVAGGGAGGSSNATTAGNHSKGGGGGGGATVTKRYDASALGSSETVVVGSGGTPVAGAAGNNGTESSFGTSGGVKIQAEGGIGGSMTISNNAPFGVAGGRGGGTTTSVQDTTSPGGNGESGWGDGGLCSGGYGGASTLGVGGLGASLISNQSVAGGVGRGVGAGGAGGASGSGGAAALGGAGTAGTVIVTEYYAAGSGAQPIDVWEAFITSAQVITGTGGTDVTGASVNVPVLSTGDRFLVLASADVQTAAGNESLTSLWVNNAQFNAQYIASGTSRNTGHMEWVVTGVPVGLINFKLRGQTFGGGNATWNTSTKITVIKLSGGTDAGAIVCTSTTRPGSPAKGDQIYETDTKTEFTWDGAAWQYTGGDDTGWITPTLLNGWIPYGAGYTTPAYRRKNGIVYLRGLIRSGTVGSSTPFFVLPSGFRPPSSTYHIYTGTVGGITSGAASTGTAHTHTSTNHGGRINIGGSSASSDGYVTTESPIGNGWVSLDGISFIAEA